MKLHYKSLGEGKPLIIIHGLFGMMDNWLSLGKRWANQYQVILVDMRNHGHSPRSSQFDYSSMVQDLEELTDDLFLDEIRIIGHSMGGKIAMKFAQAYPQLLDKLVVADIGPKFYPIHHQQILAGLKAVPLDQISSREEAKSYLSKYINEEQTIQFFLKNLYWKEKGLLDWRFHLEAIEANIENVGESMLNGRFDKDTLFIRGENSNYIVDEDIPEILEAFPKATFATIPKAGHWLHAENPNAFFEEVNQFLHQ